MINNQIPDAECWAAHCYQLPAASCQMFPERRLRRRAFLPWFVFPDIPAPRTQGSKTAADHAGSWQLAAGSCTPSML